MESKKTKKEKLNAFKNAYFVFQKYKKWQKKVNIYVNIFLDIFEQK